MPLIDMQELFSDGQALTATAISANVIDLLPNGGAVGAGATGGPSANTIRDIGAGKQMYLYIWVHTVLDSSGEAATLTATLESDSAAGLDSSATVHWSSGSIAEATLAAGYWVAKGVPIPPGNYERYLGVRYTVGTEDFTSGKVSAWLSGERFDETLYRSGHLTGVN